MTNLRKSLSCLFLLVSFTSFSQFDYKEMLLDEPYYFEEDSYIIGFSLGLLSNINLDSVALANDGVNPVISIPAINLSVEKQIWKNLGVAAVFSFQQWKVPTFEYRYNYLSGGLRGLYHLNIMDNLDPYFGLGIVFRRMFATNGVKSVGNNELGISYVLGARYYFTDQAGVFLEIGDDNISHLRCGVNLYF